MMLLHAAKTSGWTNLKAEINAGMVKHAQTMKIEWNHITNPADTNI